jgi:hypothetical protein
MRRVVACVAAGAFVLAAAPAAFGHGGNPDYRSTVRAVVPSVAGLEIRVLNYDDRLEMVNRTGKTIAIPGYDDEPYLRIRGGGSVQVNRRSPSYYVNNERYGLSAPPPQADSKAPPQWQTASKTGRYEWHDHRIHYMSKSTPPQVKDEDKRTKVFDWKVPMTAGGQPATIRGDLYWQPASNGGAPAGALIAFGIFVLVTGTFMAVVTLRRRRSRVDGGEPTSPYG